MISEVASLYQDIVEAIKMVYSSFISDEISDYNSNVYYSNPDYIRCSDVEYTLDFETILEDLGILCKNNGGTL